MYDSILTMTLPFQYADIASAIGRALDPDTGGAESFTRIIEGYEGEIPLYADIIRCQTACTSDFKDQALAIFADKSGATLFSVVQQDYLNRWQDFTPPTQEDCKVFLDNLEIM